MEKIRKMRNKEEESFEEYQKIKSSVKKKNKNKSRRTAFDVVEDYKELNLLGCVSRGFNI